MTVVRPILIVLTERAGAHYSSVRSSLYSEGANVRNEGTSSFFSVTSAQNWSQRSLDPDINQTTSYRELGPHSRP